MKSILIFLFSFLTSIIFLNNFYESIIFSIVILLLYRILFCSSMSFVFREWTLFLYAINYLVSPIITYHLPQEKVLYGMKINFDQYFNLALPGFIFFAVGLYLLPTKIFQINFKLVNNATYVNQTFLIQLTIIGMILKIISGFLPGDLAFFVYLLSMIRFVGAFALISISKKNWYLSGFVLLYELTTSFLAGAFHDALMWIIFFGLFYY